MADIKRALQRKLGPLPAWAWALIGGAAIYVYRMRGASAGGAGTPASTDAASPSQTDQTTPQDPTVLQPGESAYDPNTGQLVSAAPEQQPPLDPQSPFTVDPGQSVYDPNTGDLLSPPAAKKIAPGRKAKPPKRKPKAKPHHKATKKVKQPRQTAGKSKPRGKGRLLAVKGRGIGHVPSLKKPRTRGAATAHPSGASRVRARAPKAPAMRQRPAAHSVTHPGTQRIAPHPARAATPAHHAAPVVHHPAPRRKRK